MSHLNILLDLDGVLSDFLSGAMSRLNIALQRNKTVEDYVSEFGEFNIDRYYGVSARYFWHCLEHDVDKPFWSQLLPMRYANDLLGWLQTLGDVTICTSPSDNPTCPAQKIEWMERNFNIGSKHMMIGSKKHLMACPGNILIDDYPKNVNAFRANGGKAVLIPSNWNAPEFDLTFDLLRNHISRELNE